MQTAMTDDFLTTDVIRIAFYDYKTAGIDYVNTGGTLTFMNGETSKNITVPICNDGVSEGSETFDATLSNVTGGGTLGEAGGGEVCATATAAITASAALMARTGRIFMALNSNR